MIKTGPATGIHPVDRHVGARLRARRELMGLSQSRLAAALGLTFPEQERPFRTKFWALR